MGISTSVFPKAKTKTEWGSLFGIWGSAPWFPLLSVGGIRLAFLCMWTRPMGWLPCRGVPVPSAHGSQTCLHQRAGLTPGADLTILLPPGSSVAFIGEWTFPTKVTGVTERKRRRETDSTKNSCLEQHVCSNRGSSEIVGLVKTEVGFPWLGKKGWVV